MSTDVSFAVPSGARPQDPPELLRARQLHRRLGGALYDLGLAERVPTGWVTPACSGWYFSPVNLPQANRFVVALEDLAVVLQAAGLDERLRSGAIPGPGQQQFSFGGGAHA